MRYQHVVLTILVLLLVGLAGGCIEGDHENFGDDPSVATVVVSSVRAVPVLVEINAAPHQLVEVRIQNNGPALRTEVRIGNLGLATTLLAKGEQTVEISIPSVASTVTETATIWVDGQIAATSHSFQIAPVRAWELHLLAHSHVDIGFTAPQQEVEELHWGYLEKAIQAAKDTASYPEQARFTWNAEVLWAVESYLEQATPEKRAAFVDAVATGSLGLDALYAHPLTGLHNREQLVHLTDVSRDLQQQYGFEIDSAMITDVPGASWGIIPVLAESGVRYWSVATNNIRVGNLFRSIADRPFYWQDPTGEKRVLCWISSAGYDRFFLSPLRHDEQVVDYLYNLEQSGYPYPIAMLRYVIYDNGGLDRGLSDFVRDWNASHLAPKLILSTTREPFEALESRWGDTLPVVSGDLTPYWEDGAASTARETAQNRVSGERLVQAERLWSMLMPGPYPVQKFADAWRNSLLFAEHTWGYLYSISEPEHPLTQQIWTTKQGYALEAERLTEELLEDAVAAHVVPTSMVSAVQVFNTSSWPRNDLVRIPADWKLPGDEVRNQQDEVIPSQRLSTGELVFLATQVPALGAEGFTLHEGPASSEGTALADGLVLDNGKLRVQIDATTGAISSLRKYGVGHEFVASK